MTDAEPSAARDDFAGRGRAASGSLVPVMSCQARGCNRTCPRRRILYDGLAIGGRCAGEWER